MSFNQEYCFHLVNWIIMIQNLRFFLLFFLLILTVTVNAQKLKIIRCTTSSIIIGGVKCVVGDTFDKESKITWESPKQVLIAKDEKGRLLRFSASDKKANDSWNGNLINKQYHGLSTRDFDVMGIDGSYIIDKELLLPTGLDAEKKYVVEIFYELNNQDRCYNAKLTSGNSFMIIKKNIFDGKYEEPIRVKIVARDKMSNKELLLSNNIELIHVNRAIMPY